MSWKVLFWNFLIIRNYNMKLEEDVLQVRLRFQYILRGKLQHLSKMTCLFTLPLFFFFPSVGNSEGDRWQVGRQAPRRDWQVEYKQVLPISRKQTARQPHRETKFTIFNAVKQPDSKEKVHCFLWENRQSGSFGPCQCSHLDAAVQCMKHTWSLNCFLKAKELIYIMCNGILSGNKL